MGVYIKGMEMPKERQQLLWIYPDGKVITVKSDVDPEDNFRVVPVPPHGDLIDRDAIISVAYRDKKFGGFWGDSMAIDYVVKCANNAPTIIPASE